MTQPEPDDLPARPGEVLADKYRIDHLLGRGGMGVVMAATHHQLDQRVAIKMLLPALVTDSSVVARFSREARAVVKIQSEHVARVMDVGETAAGAPFMVMEYLDGQDLAQVVKVRGALPTLEAIDYVLQATEALAEAHVLGIVHRDVKPANLFLTRRADGSGLIKVLDFGISKATLLKGGRDVVTQTSALLGSPRFMSPEQLTSSQAVDVRTDIWSLGLTLYELLSGQAAFSADTLPQLCVAILQTPPAPLSGRRPDLPPGLTEIVMRCLEKEPDARYASVGELAAALLPFAPEHARVSVERVTRITGMSTQTRASGPGPIPLAAPAGARKVGGTQVMAETHPEAGALAAPEARRPSVPEPHAAPAAEPTFSPQAGHEHTSNPAHLYEQGPLHAMPAMGAPMHQESTGIQWAWIALLVMVGLCVVGAGGCIFCTYAALSKSPVTTLPTAASLD